MKGWKAMCNAVLDRILNEVKQLSRDEQQQLREALDIMLTGSEAQRIEGEVQRRLFAAGLLSEIKPPSASLTPYPGRALIEVKGKPLSETIIEERRWVSVLFFDSSALVKRYVSEPGSAWVLGVVDPSSGSEIYVARITAVEVISAIVRRQRTGGITRDAAAALLATFWHDLAHQYRLIEITPALVGSAMSLAAQEYPPGSQEGHKRTEAQARRAMR
jgi:predicted nucleic acid-binding protein